MSAARSMKSVTAESKKWVQNQLLWWYKNKKRKENFQQVC